MSYLSSFVSDTIYYIKSKTEAGCQFVSDKKDLKIYLDRGEKIARAASISSEFIKVDKSIRSKLESGADALGKLKDASDKADDFSALCKISRSIYILNEWSSAPPTRTDKEAAAAFDQLFGGAGQFASNLPHPLKAYSKILKQIEISSFFSNMREKMDPLSETTAKGRVLKEVMDEIDSQFKP